MIQLRLPFRRSVQLTLLALGALTPAASAQIFVDASAPPAGDGFAWATAFDNLEDALDASYTGAQIWVAAGVYKPTRELDVGDPRSVSFRVRLDRHLYGGFNGTESSLAQRAGLFDQTILSGDVGVVGSPYDNAYHVVYMLNAFVSPPTVDGFTIRDGVANGSGEHGRGAGIHSFNSQPFVRNCHITENAAIWGGGIHAQPSFMGIDACRITNNRAIVTGGGIWGQAINYKIFNTVFSGNVAGEKGGGAYIHSISSSFEHQVLFSSCVFHDNVSARGGAAYVGGSNITAGHAWFVNCTIAYNRAWMAGGGVWAGTNGSIPAKSYIYNSVVWNNWAPLHPNLHGRQIQRYSLVQGGYHGSPGMIWSPPTFVNAAARDLRLAPGSRGIDAGNNALLPFDYIDLNDNGLYDDEVPYDADRNPRRADDPATADTGSGGAPIVDMGAYEH